MPKNHEKKTSNSAPKHLGNISQAATMSGAKKSLAQSQILPQKTDTKKNIEKGKWDVTGLPIIAGPLQKPPGPGPTQRTLAVVPTPHGCLLDIIMIS